MTRQGATSECFKWWQKGLENINAARDVKHKGYEEEIKEDIAFMEIVWRHLLSAKIQKSGSAVLAHQHKFKLAVLVFLAILMFQLPGSWSCFNCKLYILWKFLYLDFIPCLTPTQWWQTSRKT